MMSRIPSPDSLPCVPVIPRCPRRRRRPRCGRPPGSRTEAPSPSPPARSAPPTAARCPRASPPPPPPPLHLGPLPPPKPPADVVPRLTLIQQLPEHLHARGDRLLRRTNPQNLHLVPHLDHPALHTARHHRPATRNPKPVLHRQQKQR